MGLLLDTHIIVWLATGSSKLGSSRRRALARADAAVFVSAVTVWEYVELDRRGRFGMNLPLVPVLNELGAQILDFPANAWRRIIDLPDIHRDPVDRMMIAHALEGSFTLVTADENVRRYPVRCI